VPVHRQEVHERIRARQDAALTLAFTGATSGDNALAAELEVADAGLGGRDLVLDFTNVRRINSLELGTLVGLHERLKCRGARMTLVRMDANVREVFAVTRLDTFLAIVDGP
jgi:anti-anti-sigma factor